MRPWPAQQQIAELPRRTIKDTKRIVDDMHLERAILATLDFALSAEDRVIFLAGNCGPTSTGFRCRPLRRPRSPPRNASTLGILPFRSATPGESCSLAMSHL